MYCNYSKDKFGNELTFIEPPFDMKAGCSNDREIGVDFTGEVFNMILTECEKSYFRLLKKGWAPQQARSVLPNSLKTELIMTGSSSQWKHFFQLRDANAAHPQARELAQPLHEEFKKLGYV